MVTTGAILYGKCFHQLDYNPQEHPIAVQLGGSDIKDLVELSLTYEELRGLTTGKIALNIEKHKPILVILHMIIISLDGQGWG